MERPAIAPAGSKWLWRVSALFVTVIPLFIWQAGRDAFREPKDALLRAGGFAVIACLAILVIHGRIDLKFALRDRLLLIPIAILVWSAITTLTSSNRALSINSLGWVIASVAIFLGGYLGGGGRPIKSLGIALLLPGLINALLVLAQATQIWQPFKFVEELDPGARFTGLVGNPRDLGAFLLLPSLFALAATVLSSGRSRLVLGVATALLAAGLIATRGITTAVAYGVAVAVMLLLHTPRRWLLVSVGVAAAFGAITLYGPLRERFRSQNFDRAVLNRVTGPLAAWRMGLAHPLLGVGPGCFGFNYYDYKLAVEREYPPLQQVVTRHLNLGEAHNDHLQIFAVSGIPGYALFASALIGVASISFRRAKTKHEALAKLLALPCTVAVAIVASTFFPLELAAPIATYSFTAGTLAAWRPR